MHHLNAQIENLGIGLQSIWKSTGISGKYEINPNISAQAILAPFATSAGYPGLAVMTFQVRGIYKFFKNAEVFVPYCAVGTGILVASSSSGLMSANGYGGSRGSALAWNVGAGFEILPVETFGLSFEYGYGAANMTPQSDTEKFPLLMFGMHYYFKE